MERDFSDLLFQRLLKAHRFAYFVFVVLRRYGAAFGVAIVLEKEDLTFSGCFVEQYFFLGHGC
jgi:hypothetical protein